MKKEELINNILDNWKTPEIKSKDQIWEKVQASISTNEVSETKVIKPRFSMKRLMPLGIAASIALAVFFLLPGSQDLAVFETQPQEQKEVTLPDGSSVWLGPQSTLSYTEDEDSRDLTLDGEAFFDVVKGKTFTVKANDIEVKVLGTSFNVNSRNTEFDVKCFTGKVNVTSDAGSLDLTPGLATSSNSKMETYVHRSIQKIDAKGQLSFDGQTLNTILTDLELYKGIKISNVSGKNPVVSIEFLDESPEEILVVLSKISSLNFKTLGENKFELY